MEQDNQMERPRTGPETDHEQAGQLLRLIAGDGAVTFQTFDDDDEQKRRRLTQVMHGRLAQKGVRLDSLNSDGAGVFFMVNEGDGKGRRAKNVLRVRALFADLDGAPLAPVLAFPLKPHAVVETSSNKFHVYWCVDDVPLDAFKPLQKAIAARFGSDRSVNDLCRVARLPGFFHRKQAGSPFQTRIVSLEQGRRYSVDEVSAAFPCAAEPAAAQSQGARTRYRMPDQIVQGQRNTTLYAIARQMVNKCIPLSEANKRLQAVNAKRCDPPLCATEVDDIVASAFAKPADVRPPSPLELMLSEKVRALSSGAFRLFQHAVYQAHTVRNGELEIDPAHLPECMSLKHGYRFRRQLIAAGLIEPVRNATYNELGRECALFRIPGLPKDWGPA